MKTQNFIFLLLLFGNSISLKAQSDASYLQSNKEVEFNYGVVAPEQYERLTDIEKIKYQLRYEERTVVKKILEGNTFDMEVKIDSTNFEEPWMDLAKRFHYSDQGIDLFDRSGQLSQHVEYTEEQVADRSKMRTDLAENGFHPGLASFPEFTTEIRNLLTSGGIVVIDMSPTIVKLQDGPDHATIFDTKHFTITEEWTDNDGYRNTELRGYEPYLQDRGYLLMLLKHERFITSVNGPCITEVKLKYYSDYKIEDRGNFIDKATNNYTSLSLYPNPNNGVFQASISGPPSLQIIQTEIINNLTGQIEVVNATGLRNFSIEKPNLAAGNYTLRIVTNISTLTSSFIKQ